MQSSELTQNQDWLILFMEAVGYKSNRQGICFGFSIMGLQAFFSGELIVFNKRINFIHDIYLLSLESAKKNLQVFLVENKTTEKNKTELLIQFLKEQMKKDFQLLPTEDKVDIDAFFNGIELAHQTHFYEELYEFDKELQVQTPQTVLAAFSIIASKKLIELGGLVHIGGVQEFTFIVNDLAAKFNSLRQKLINISAPVGLVVTSSEPMHAISVGFNPENKTWIFTNVEQLPLKEIKDDKELAVLVVSAFNSLQKVKLRSEVYCCGKDKTMLLDPILNWKEKQLLIESKKDMDQLKAEPNTPKFEALQNLKKLAEEAKESKFLDYLRKCFNDLEIQEQQVDNFLIKSPDSMFLKSARKYLDYSYGVISQTRNVDDLKHISDKAIEYIINRIDRHLEVEYHFSPLPKNKCHGFFYKAASWGVVKVNELLYSCRKKNK